MNTEEKSSYFKELDLNLRHEGFTTGPEEDSLLPVELDGQRLCLAKEGGGISYWKEDVSGDRCAALDKVIAIAETTAAYVSQMETAPQLEASSLTGDYRLLASFNNTVLAGHPTKYGIQFITWEQVQNKTVLHQGHYYGPSVGTSGYTSAKRDFAVRAGLIPDSVLFTPEQLTGVYRCIHETLDSGYPITEDRRKCLESATKQIKHSVPDLDERVSLSNTKELEYADALFAENSGMQFR